MSNPEMKKWIDSLQRNKVSFIVPTIASRSPFLEELLNVLSAKTPQLKQLSIESEIIIVADGFSAPVDILKKYTHLNIVCISIPERTGTVSVPRNVGISHATGNIIAPTDDDVLPYTNKISMIKSLIDAVAKNETGVHGNKIGLAYGARKEAVLPEQIFTNQDRPNFLSLEIRPSLDQRPLNHWVFNKDSLGIDNGQFVYTADVYENIEIGFPVNACDWELYSAIAKYYDFQCYDNKQAVALYLWHKHNISRVPKDYRVDPRKILHKYINYFAPNVWRDKVSKLL